VSLFIFLLSLYIGITFLAEAPIPITKRPTSPSHTITLKAGVILAALWNSGEEYYNIPVSGLIFILQIIIDPNCYKLCSPCPTKNDPYNWYLYSKTSMFNEKAYTNNERRKAYFPFPHDKSQSQRDIGGALELWRGIYQ
jgi:hypothetical protein